MSGPQGRNCPVWSLTSTPRWSPATPRRSNPHQPAKAVSGPPAAASWPTPARRCPGGCGSVPPASTLPPIISRRSTRHSRRSPTPTGTAPTSRSAPTAPDPRNPAGAARGTRPTNAEEDEREQRLTAARSEYRERQEESRLLVQRRLREVFTTSRDQPWEHRLADTRASPSLRRPSKPPRPRPGTFLGLPAASTGMSVEQPKRPLTQVSTPPPLSAAGHGATRSLPRDLTTTNQERCVQRYLPSALY